MQATPSAFALTETIIFTGEAFVERHALLVQDGQIVDLCQSHAIGDAFEVIPCAGRILAPGYVDLQVNGGGNRPIDDKIDARGILEIAACHAKTGTTSLVPTYITSSFGTMTRTLNAVRAARKVNRGILGIHFEGPHINPEKRGAHNAKDIRPLCEDDFDLYSPQGDEVMRVTLAPECAAIAQIERLCEQDVLVAMGHSLADAQQAKAAFEAGAPAVTHWMNTMPPILAREPGLGGFALDEKGCWLSFIGDLQHVDPIMIRLAVKAKEEKNIFIVSDAATPAGAEVLQGVRYVNEEGRLAGSLLTLGQCVPLLIARARLDPALVLRMASTLPAQYLGLNNILGKLLPGYRADILALDSGFSVQEVWKGGGLV